MYTAQGRIKQSELLTQYMPLVRRQALTLQVRLPASIELDDLIQAGMVGLLEALGRFDAAQGATFATFASQRIRGAMMDELRTRDWLPRSVRRSARAVDDAVRRLEQQLGRPPEEGEIARELEMPLSEYQQLLNDTNSGQLLPFEELVADGGEPAGDDAQHRPFDQLLDEQQRHTLIEAIEALPEREKLLMALYYQEEMNLKEVGAVLGVTESRVSQLHSQAVSRLRARLRDHDES
ncbi:MULTISPECIES: RNA polymerase sigma factor FliA [Halomonadaceae]|jgi:RNA polymerase sigma factor for flagellar operon FliA|uniref:RNA polymerase sigma factor FliA n=1 Tax=Vreelandella piezotolerans TaxID=2609667 RepID=A0ABQ6X992_9GAMM|nr:MULTISPECIES: RNA polymerase sigma factor FliA [Halomonas]KFC50721.1 flagellar biosynthesis sigma factor [Halomonas sp. SUBG004]KAE8438584.1 RNA polymerase sigma factor FliA [Halomonas piezotolerans]MCG7576877.1 RNA polymerase sigma factor FliA [Halomonas sp. MMH1-48]MCG7591442.1 RNA polymerase sigma factor FliA [Halomonas sp. McD50-5]MCG7603940.1 RNA polymerase sigma factor FliA [Halomonas sp. MM17-34]|tara:strand:- start:463 stop:1170 length:708 start_codon:yes stop_codon:yes gene_type:complete